MIKVVDGVHVEMTDEEVAEFLASFVVSREPVPPVISDRQFFQELAVRKIITEEQALAAVMTGTMPPAIVGFIAAMPEDQRFSANMLLSGATTFERTHSITTVFGVMFGMDDAGIDQFWRDAFTL